MGKLTEVEKRYRNVIGPQVARARITMGLTQSALAAKLQIAGLETIDNIGVSKIENQVRSVYDYELQIIAHTLKVPIEQLYPAIAKTKNSLDDLRRGHRPTIPS